MTKRFFAVLVLVFFAVPMTTLRAEEGEANLGSLYRKQFLSTPAKRGSVHLPGNGSTDSSTLRFDEGIEVTVHTPSRWNRLGTRLLSSLEDTHLSYREAFGDIPSFKTSIRLMDEDTFYLSTGAPTWTNALYYKGQILIPISESSARDYPNLYRSVKHEYMHAIVNALSGGRCPGWLDEGLAQWSEGDENPALRPALFSYLRSNPPVSLALLQSGFTKLETRMVPAAYAQSLYATTGLIDSHGLGKIATYLRKLRDGKEKGTAFHEAFESYESSFESDLARLLTGMAKADLH